MSKPESLGEIIGRGRAVAFRGKKHKIEALALNWQSIVGDAAWRHSRPTRISRGTLTVSADAPAWAAEISAQIAEIMKRVAKVMGDGSIKKVRVQARALGAKEDGRFDCAAEKGPPVEPQQLAVEVEQSLETVEDEETRDALEKMLRASMASEQSKHREC